MPADPPISKAGPVTSDGGWAHLMRVLSVTVPANLYYTGRTRAAIRKLRRR